MAADMSLHRAHRGASRIVLELMGVEPGEGVLLVVDDTSDALALDLINKALGDARSEVHRAAAEDFIKGLDEQADVVVSLAAPLLTHADEMRRRLRAGARYANLRGLDSDLLQQASETDFDAVHSLTRSLAQRMSSVVQARVQDDAGTDLRLKLAGGALALSGVARNGGEVGGFPGGEVALVPVAGSVHGTIRDPRFIEGFAGHGAGAVIQVRDSVIELDESSASSYLNSKLARTDAARSVGEFGLGTNGVLLASSPRTAKKRLGMVHFGIGDNRTFGGEIVADAHIDVILAAPTVTLDGHELIRRGELRSP